MSAAVMNATQDPTMERLEDQIGWYDSKSRSNMRWYKRIKFSEIASAAIIPFLAALHIPHVIAVTGALGVLVTVFEGLLQLNQFHENWIRYRSTCESLKHEKYLYLAGAGAYSGVANARSVLAQRIEALVSQEHAKWATFQEQDLQGKPA